MCNSSLFKCHCLGSDHLFGKRDERQRGPNNRARNLYAQISWKSYNVSKTIGKICETKYFIKINKLWGTIFVVIFFYKRIYLSDYFTLITIWKTTMKTFSWFQRSIEDHKWLVPEWIHWTTKIMYVVLLWFLGLVRIFCEAYSSLWSLVSMWSHFFQSSKASFPMRVILLIRRNLSIEGSHPCL